MVYHSNSETRQEYKVIFSGERVFGQPTVNDEASAVRWWTRDDLPGLDTHQSQRRQFGHRLNGTYPHCDKGSLAARTDQACGEA